MTAKKVLLLPINSTLISLGVGAGRGRGNIDSRWTMMNPVTRRINQCQPAFYQRPSVTRGGRKFTQPCSCCWALNERKIVSRAAKHIITD